MKNFLTKITENKFGAFVKKNSPKILLGTGIASFIGGAVYACFATLKADKIVKENKEKEQMIKDLQHPEYSEEDRTNDLRAVKIKTAFSVAKTYTPAFLMEAAGTVCVLASYNILNNRYIALGAAYASLGSSFLGYRKRVAKKYGEEEEYKIFHGIETQTIEEKSTDKKGNEVVEKKEVEVVGDTLDSDYVRYITKGHPMWEGWDEIYTNYMKIHLDCVQAELNEKLKVKGFVTLNEAYYALGFPETKAGMVVGWTSDTKNRTDGYIQFFCDRVKVKSSNGSVENAFAIDFNVDGNIYNELI